MIVFKTVFYIIYFVSMLMIEAKILEDWADKKEDVFGFIFVIFLIAGEIITIFY